MYTFLYLFLADDCTRNKNTDTKKIYPKVTSSTTDVMWIGSGELATNHLNHHNFKNAKQNCRKLTEYVIY
jgi:surface antigen